MTMNVTWYRGGSDQGPVAKDMMQFDNARSIASAANSTATPDGCTYVKVTCTEAAYVAYGLTVGKTPTASASNGDYVPAGIPQYYAAVPGYAVGGIAV